MKKFLLFGIFSATLLSCRKEILQIPVLTANSSLDKSPIYHESGKQTNILNYDWYASCTQEYIHVTGEIVLTYSSIQVSGLSKPEGTSYTIEFHYQNVHAVGNTSGKAYTLTGHNTHEANIYYIFYPGEQYYTPFTENITGKNVWVTSGGGNNEVITVSYHVTRNASGDLIVENISYISSECQ